MNWGSPWRFFDGEVVGVVVKVVTMVVKVGAMVVKGAVNKIRL